jgi:hypothetical protein
MNGLRIFRRHSKYTVGIGENRPEAMDDSRNDAAVLDIREKR